MMIKSVGEERSRVTMQGVINVFLSEKLLANSYRQAAITFTHIFYFDTGSLLFAARFKC